MEPKSVSAEFVKSPYVVGDRGEAKSEENGQPVPQELTAEEQEAKAIASREIFIQGATSGGVARSKPTEPLPKLSPDELSKIDGIQRQFMMQAFVDVTIHLPNREAHASRLAETEKFEKEATSEVRALLRYTSYFMLDFMQTLIASRFSTLQDTSKEYRLAVLKTALQSKIGAQLEELKKQSTKAIQDMVKLDSVGLLEPTIQLQHFINNMGKIPHLELEKYLDCCNAGNYKSELPQFRDVAAALDSVSAAHRAQFIKEMTTASKSALVNAEYAHVSKALVENPQFQIGVRVLLGKPEDAALIRTNIATIEKLYQPADRAVYNFIVKSSTIMFKQMFAMVPEAVLADALKRVLHMNGSKMVVECREKIEKVNPEYLLGLIKVDSMAEEQATLEQQGRLIEDIKRVDKPLQQRLKAILEAEKPDLTEMEELKRHNTIRALFVFLDTLPEKLRSSIAKGVVAAVNQHLS